MNVLNYPKKFMAGSIRPYHIKNQRMKTILLLSMAVIALLATPACKKHKDSVPSEARLTVQTTPANGITDAAAPGPDFYPIIQITSAMPSGGVKIDLTAKVDGSGNAPFFTYSKNSTSASNNITITGTPSGVVCLVNITVTSLSDGTNVWNGSYRYSAK